MDERHSRNGERTRDGAIGGGRADPVGELRPGERLTGGALGGARTADERLGEARREAAREEVVAGRAGSTRLPPLEAAVEDRSVVESVEKGRGDAAAGYLGSVLILAIGVLAVLGLLLAGIGAVVLWPVVVVVSIAFFVSLAVRGKR